MRRFPFQPLSFAPVAAKEMQKLLAAPEILPEDEPGWGLAGQADAYQLFAYLYDNDLVSNGWGEDMEKYTDFSSFRRMVLNAATRFVYGYPTTFLSDGQATGFRVLYPSKDAATYTPKNVIDAAVALVRRVLDLSGGQPQLVEITWNDIPLTNPDVPWDALYYITAGSVSWKLVGDFLEQNDVVADAHLPPPWLLQDYEGVITGFSPTPQSGGLELRDLLPWSSIPWSGLDFQSIPWARLRFTPEAVAALSDPDLVLTTQGVIDALSAAYGLSEPPTIGADDGDVVVGDDDGDKGDVVVGNDDGDKGDVVVGDDDGNKGGGTSFDKCKDDEIPGPDNVCIKKAVCKEGEERTADNKCVAKPTAETKGGAEETASYWPWIFGGLAVAAVAGVYFASKGKKR